MSVREVLRMGHPVLRERAKKVENVGTPELRALVRDMKETMASKNGAGLAAPQIGVSERVVIYGILYPQRMTDMSRFGFVEELFPGEDITDD